MKLLKYLFICSLLAVIAVACNKGLDPINPVDPGTDELSPEISITFPTEGKIVRSPDSVATVFFKFLASDDFELKSVVVNLDGTEIGNITSFKDYRRLDASFEYGELRNGEHTLTVTASDFTDKTASKTVNFLKITTEVYVPLDGEVLYFPFDGDYMDAIAAKELTIVGAPDFVNEGKINLAYQGATDSYLTIQTDDMITTHEFSASFWMKINAVPDRAGILTMSAEDLANPGYPNVQNLRTSGFRFFREASGTKQIIKDNVGFGTGECWNDGGLVDPSTGEWFHLAFTISETTSSIYINGELARESVLTAPIDWTGCNLLSIMSGAPRFTEWNHFSDLSLLDELHIFKRVLTPEEIQSFYAAKK